MNLQSTHQLKGVKKKKNVVRRVSRRGDGTNFKAFVPLILMIGVIFAMTAGVVRVNSEIETLGREAFSLNRQIHKRDRDISNTKIKIAALKGVFIFHQMRRFGIHLRNPSPGQIRRLRVYERYLARGRSKTIVKEPKLLLSRR